MRPSVAWACPFLIAAVQVGCSGGTPGTAPVATLDRASTSVARSVGATRADRRPTWISPELARSTSQLLFVSDSGTADVYIYKLPTLKLMATITGFAQPQGECSDGKGNIWVTDTNAKTIYELSHQGRLENELSDGSGYPAACAWDSTTGNLAVSNLFGIASGSGSILIYKNASESPVSYENPGQYYYNFAGYDTAGNLFFDGRDAKGDFMLSELPKGGGSAKTIALSGGTIYFPGMVQWQPTRRNLIVGDQSCGNLYASCLYTVKITQQGGTIAAETQLRTSTGGSVCDLVQGVEFNKQIAGSDYDFCGAEPSTTYVWPYPAGGTSVAHNEGTELTPVGAAISK